MRIELFAVLLFAVIFVGCMMSKHGLVEGMGGYSVISGLAYNNNSTRCFTNPHDPPGSAAYCTVIGKVTI